MDNDELSSLISREDKEKERAIWEDKDLKIKREATKNELNFAFKNFILKARREYANEDFIAKVRKIQKEYYKLAKGVAEIHAKIKELESQILLSENQLNPNQKQTKDKFDELISTTSQLCQEHNITINQYNSGAYKEDNSLWNMIFENSNVAIIKDISQDIVDKVILALIQKRDRIIEDILFKRSVKETKKAVQEESFEIYYNNLTPRAKEIREKFISFQEPLKNKYNKDFWENVVAKARREAMEREIDDEELDSIFKMIERETNNPKYLKANADNTKE